MTTLHLKAMFFKWQSKPPTSFPFVGSLYWETLASRNSSHGFLKGLFFRISLGFWCHQGAYLIPWRATSCQGHLHCSPIVTCSRCLRLSLWSTSQKYVQIKLKLIRMDSVLDQNYLSISEIWFTNRVGKKVNVIRPPKCTISCLTWSFV